MKVQLTRRHYGVHDMVKEADIPGTLADYATVKPPSGNPYDGREYDIDEAKLAAALPEGFLLAPVRRVLLGINDTAQSGLTVFRDWGKYFDAYMLWLRTPESLEEEAAS
jgi:hypothetical protein